MIAAYLERAGKLSVKDVERPICGADEALVRIVATGICGSDLHYFREGRIKNNIITSPLVLGHESAGEVVEVGPTVTHLRAGDRVTIEPGVPCGECQHCLTGRYNLCTRVVFLGAPPHHGTFRQFVNHKALFVHKLPQSVSFDEGATVEPLAVGFHAVSRVDISPGDRVLVTGAGPIGLLAMMFARIAGGTVTISDPDVYRLGVAQHMGADAAHNPNDEGLPTSAFDCVIEATGVPGIYRSVIDALATGGRIAVVGMSNEAPTLDLTALMRKEASIYTVYRYANCFQPVLRLMEAGKIDVSSLVTHRFDLRDIVSAFDFAGNPTQNKMKIVVESDSI